MSSQITRRDACLSALLIAGGAGLISHARAKARDAGDSSSTFVPNERAVRPVGYSEVLFKDAFWRTKIDKVIRVTLPACIAQIQQKTGRIRNFEKAARNQGETHEGYVFDDSDVYKTIEVMAYALRHHPDPQLEAVADDWIQKIAAAQQPDGYLNTYYTLKGLSGRWTDMGMHEDFCAGHLIEAAVAYYATTGKRALLDVAIRFADHIDNTFRLENRHWVSGHEEIELALVKLYRSTHESRYFKLAQWYLEQRGHGFGRGQMWEQGDNTDFCQDSVPVKEQTRATGHAVRAMYLYSAMADIAALSTDEEYARICQALWNDVVSRHLYVTGGVGSSAENEGFSPEYDLPNEEAYCETCASCGMVFWNHRMALLTGDGKYMDVLERTLYNGALDGLSLYGDRFFYTNPLASSDKNSTGGRSEWFAVACCPPNIARLTASLGGYLYARSQQDLWVNLYATSGTRVQLDETQVDVEVATEYPWDGKITVQLNPTKSARFRLHLRIPSWARGVAVPGGLYQFTNSRSDPIEVLLNGKPVHYRDEKGYAVIERAWRRGDIISVNLPMNIKQVISRPEIAADGNRVALQRGPIMYCVEGSDNGGDVWNLVLQSPERMEAYPNRVVDEALVALRLQATQLAPTVVGFNLDPVTRTVIANPYYSWANRGNYNMLVWLPTKITGVKVNA